MARPAGLSPAAQAGGRAAAYRARLELVMKYDRLSLPQWLDALDAEYSKGGMADAGELVPVLEAIAADPSHLRMAQRKAQSLLERIRDGRPTLEFEKALLQPQLSHWTVRVRDDGQARYSFASGATGTSSRGSAGAQGASPAPSQTFSLSRATTQQLFSLATRMKNFRGATSGRLQPRQLLLMEISLAFEKGPEHYRVTYVSSPGGKAGRLVKMFERIANQRWHAGNLSRAMSGMEGAGARIELWRALTLLEADLKKQEVAEPEALVPLLRAIAASGRLAPEEADLVSRILQSLGKSVENLGHVMP
jgi:hypothetical protein